jgi:hypothetical protein
MYDVVCNNQRTQFKTIQGAKTFARYNKNSHIIHYVSAKKYTNDPNGRWLDGIKVNPLIAIAFLGFTVAMLVKNYSHQ